MGLKKVTGLWINTRNEGKEAFMRIGLGVMGKFVLSQTQLGEWSLLDVTNADAEEPGHIATIKEKRTLNQVKYMVLDLGLAGKFVLFENEKLHDNSPDWTMNREIADAPSKSSRRDQGDEEARLQAQDDAEYASERTDNGVPF